MSGTPDPGVSVPAHSRILACAAWARLLLVVPVLLGLWLLAGWALGGAA